MHIFLMLLEFSFLPIAVPVLFYIAKRSKDISPTKEEFLEEFGFEIMAINTSLIIAFIFRLFGDAHLTHTNPANWVLGAIILFVIYLILTVLIGITKTNIEIKNVFEVSMILHLVFALYIVLSQSAIEWSILIYILISFVITFLTFGGVNFLISRFDISYIPKINQAKNIEKSIEEKYIGAYYTYKEDDFEGAIKEYLNVINSVDSTNPILIDSYVFLSEAYEKQRDYDAALEAINNAVKVLKKVNTNKIYKNQVLLHKAKFLKRNDKIEDAKKVLKEIEENTNMDSLYEKMRLEKIANELGFKVPN